LVISSCIVLHSISTLNNRLQKLIGVITCSLRESVLLPLVLIISFTTIIMQNSHRNRNFAKV
jgi:hypothetical protein